MESRQLRHVSDAFQEDPLRILRTARFAARLQPLGFRVADDTMALMTRMVQAGEINHLVPERVWQEIQRALHENEPGTFFTVLQDCGALEYLIPELKPDDAFETALESLRCAHARKLETEARFAALLSPLANQASSDQNLAEQRAKELKAPNDCIALVRLLTETAPALESGGPLKPDDALALLNATDAWRRPERFATLITALGCVLRPDSTAKTEQLQKALEAANSVNAKTLMAEGFSGKALGDAIQSERLNRIRQLFHSE
jgi:tRNA nucleotidyltransferase (CCA-adding enzyme)